MAETKSKSITARVRELLTDWLPSQGYELWNVEFVKSGQDRNLNVYIDRFPASELVVIDTNVNESETTSNPAVSSTGISESETGYAVSNAGKLSGVAAPAGIGTDDCEIVSRYLSEHLDEENLIDANYYLIVSSPGMDRQLFTDEHFKRYEGSVVDVSLYKGVDGRKSYSGTLVSRTDESLNIISETDGRELSLPGELVSKVRLKVVF